MSTSPSTLMARDGILESKVVILESSFLKGVSPHGFDGTKLAYDLTATATASIPSPRNERRNISMTEHATCTPGMTNSANIVLSRHFSNLMKNSTTLFWP